MVDADTELFSDALTRLLACCMHDSKIIEYAVKHEL